MIEIMIYCVFTVFVTMGIHTWGYCQGLKDAEKIWKTALIEQKNIVLEMIREMSDQITKSPKGPNDN